MADANYFMYRDVPLYGQKEIGLDNVSAETACWFACIKMMMDFGEPVAVTPPPLLMLGGSYEKLVLEQAMIHLGLVPLNLDSSQRWTMQRLADTLEEWGPVMVMGNFGPGYKAVPCFGMQHALVVTGVAANCLIYFNDPWYPLRSHMGDGWFDRQHCKINRFTVSGAFKNKKNWKSVEP